MYQGNHWRWNENGNKRGQEFWFYETVGSCLVFASWVRQEAYSPVRNSGSGVGSEISSRHWFSRGTVATTRPSGSCWSKPRAKLFCLETEADFHFWVSRWTPLLGGQSIAQPTIKKILPGPRGSPPSEPHLMDMSGTGQGVRGRVRARTEKKDISWKGLLSRLRTLFPPSLPRRYSWSTLHKT